MDRFDKIYRLHNILCSRRAPVSMKVFEETLECSRATVARTIEELRDRLGAPLVYDRKRRGYHYDQVHGEHPYELPGLWFSAEELEGLLICHQLLRNIGPGILRPQIEHIRNRIEKLLSRHGHSVDDTLSRVKILSIGSRLKDDTRFLRAATALFNRKRLHIVYRARSSDEETSREISPQSLVYYRDNWYLDAWCHLRDELRTFAVDKIESARVLKTAAQKVPTEELEKHFASSYGIFAGEAEHTAVLEFSPDRARWVSDEKWHPRQAGRWLEDGRYELRIPFKDHRELLMDILKYGAEVEVKGPEFLVEAVKGQVGAMGKLYGQK